MADDATTDNLLDRERSTENEHSKDCSGEASLSKTSLEQASSQQAEHAEALDSNRVPSRPEFDPEAERMSSDEDSASRRKTCDKQVHRDKTCELTETASRETSPLQSSGKEEQGSKYFRLRRKDQDGGSSSTEFNSGVKCELLASASRASGRAALCQPRYKGLENKREALESFLPDAMYSLATPRDSSDRLTIPVDPCSSALEKTRPHPSDSSAVNPPMAAARSHPSATSRQPVEGATDNLEGELPLGEPHLDASVDQDNECLGYETMLQWAQEVSRIVTCVYFLGAVVCALLEDNNLQATFCAVLVLFVLYYPFIFS